MNIGLYVGSWPQNIGNAFFDLGSEAIVRRAIVDSKCYYTGGAVHWTFSESRSQRFGKLASKLVRKFGRNSSPTNSMEIAQFVETDILVFAGMSLCEEFIHNNGITIRAAAARGIPILGLGVGASTYSARESRAVTEFLNHIPRAAFITRDEDTFRMLTGVSHPVLSGIDCAFFLPEAFEPPKLDLAEFDVETFDERGQTPKVEHGGRLVIRTHHDLWGPLPRRYMKHANTLVSDVPQDYLTIYSQAHTTFSDRVHACVATLAYGGRAQLFSNTPRRALFDQVGAESVYSRVISVNQDRLSELKQQQISMTSKLISDLVK